MEVVIADSQNQQEKLIIQDQKEETLQSKRNIKSIIFNLALSQILALISVANAYFSSTLQNNYLLETPTLIVFFYYVGVFLIFYPITRCFNKPKLVYFFIALFDSQGNFLNILAFSYLRFTLAFIISISSIVWTFIFTFFFIKTYKYRIPHFAGIIIALCGVGLSSYANYETTNTTKNDNNVLGVILALVASICYAGSSILQEINLKTGKEIIAFYPWFSIFGMCLTAIESAIMGDFVNLARYNKYDVKVIIYLFLSSFTLVSMVSMVPLFISRVSASMFNISMVSSIFWSYVLTQIIGPPLNDSVFFYIGFFFIVAGLVTFNIFNYAPVIQKKEETVIIENNPNN